MVIAMPTKNQNQQLKHYRINPPGRTYLPPSKRPDDLKRKQALDAYEAREARKAIERDSLDD